MTQIPVFCIGLAHKGANQVAPENTLSAFKKAIEFGIQGIELDARQTLDGEFVVRHDSSLDKTTTGKGETKDNSLADIEKIDALGPEGTRDKIPTLKKALQYLIGNVSVIMIELKEGDPEALVNLVKHETETNVGKTTILFYSKEFNEKLATLVGRDNFIASPKCKKNYRECVSKLDYASVVVINWGDYYKQYVEACTYFGKKIMFNVIGTSMEQVPEIRSAIASNSVDFVIGDKMNELKLYQQSFYV